MPPTQTPVEGWLQAFAAHPRLGDVVSLRAQYGQFAELSSSEQSALLGGVPGEHVITELAALNAQYERRHGFIFILSATGKSAADVLAAIRAR